MLALLKKDVILIIEATKRASLADKNSQVSSK
jgi:hypothetical protein